ncbi:MAG TPA: 3-oxoacyl-ACP reductase [Gammaproteobacteria bacterium]|nr:3-oxoacyl-ACP reductase [Gammaproteobacteria bacterium]
MELGLQQRWALITGSHRGTGEVIAACLAAEQANVIVHGFGESEARSSAQEIGVQHYVFGDLRTPKGAASIYEQVLSITETLHILVNNYGEAEPGKWFQTSETDWLRVYEKNVLSAMHMVNQFAPAMREQGWGRIIQLSTIGALTPNSRMPHYYASKAALVNFSLSLAKELSCSGVTVNCVSPGLIKTPEVTAGLMAKAQSKGWGNSWEEVEPKAVSEKFPNLVGRIARREEIAALVCFLASERAAFINGQNIRIDGGAVELAF